MPHTTSHPEDENFNFRVTTELKAAFKSATKAADRPKAQVLRDFMRAYVEQNRPAEPGSGIRFRGQVQAAIDDPRPSVPHMS